MVDVIRNVPDVTIDPDDSDIVADEGHDVTITRGDTTLTPVHVGNYSFDSFGANATLTDQCGNRELRESGATGFQVTIEGILSLDQLRTARQMGLNEGTTVEIALKPWTDIYTLESFSADKKDDINEWYSPEYPEGVDAYTFQLQTKDPTTNG